MLPRHKTGTVKTRGHELKLEKRECRSQMRAKFFRMRVVNLWNRLPAEVVESPSVNCLKGRFDRYS